MHLGYTEKPATAPVFLCLRFVPPGLICLPPSLCFHRSQVMAFKIAEHARYKT